ncbi:MAG: YebC/PmpR family DNA-binding transcriptional regulator [Phycisphaerae bacterium]|nr:YebC/PmpR family DNA-binding transcriptional regulator [Phycisphaerae bacterium]
MAGHSHWAKIKRTKSAIDARRGREWGKLARRIIVAAKVGGGNPEENLSLRYAIDEAKAANMPNDTIDKAIKKGTGELGAENYESVIYEGYGPGGVAFLVECLTNNRNRTAPQMRRIFEQHGGQLGSTNCVAWMFQPAGALVVSCDAAEEDTLMELALETGADDVENQGDAFQITCQPAAFGKVKAALAERNIPTLSGRVAMMPTRTVPVTGDAAKQVLALMEAMEEHEDVQNVYANFDMPDEVMDTLAG